MNQYSMIDTKVYDNGVVLLTLNKPPVNAICHELLNQIRALFEEMNKDDTLRAVVLTGTKRSFSAGSDMNGWGVLPKGMLPLIWRTALGAMESSRLPIIAAIEGHCLGGGLELALACDIRIASETASIALTEAKLGLLASNGGVTRLPWLIGEANAKRMFFTAEKLDGNKALRYGVVQEVCAPEALLDRALELAGDIAKNAPRSITAAKRVMNEFRAELCDSSYIREWDISPFVLESEDFKEGVRAFREKRPPVWKNK